jgi:hypothetical protein
LSQTPPLKRGVDGDCLIVFLTAKCIEVFAEKAKGEIKKLKDLKIEKLP